MEHGAIYGAMMIAYLVPYAIWVIGRDQKVEMLKEFYPGRADEKAIDRRGFQVAGVWIVGLLVLLAGWKLRWHPAPTFLIVLTCWVAFGAARRIPKLSGLLRTRRTRAVVAAATVWPTLVLAWYVLFGERYDVKAVEVGLLAIVPIPVALLAYGAYLWVSRGEA